MHTTVFRLVLMITVVQITVATHGIALAAPISPQEAARGLIQRIVPTKADQFLLETIPAENGRDVFEIENRDGKVVIRGSSGVAIASGWNWYLKYYCHCHVSLWGNQSELPDPLPAVP
jgi:alpha-N-acetylglucosaminidase